MRGIGFEGVRKGETCKIGEGCSLGADRNSVVTAAVQLDTTFN